MQTVLFHYEMLPTTWFYLSSLMIIAIFFRFDRFWSVRNLDLIALMLFTPGILSIAAAFVLDHRTTSPYGYMWLYGVGLYFTVRLLLDPLMARRPLLEPNLSAPAMTFTCVALLLFLFGGLIVGRGALSDLGGMVRLDQMFALRARLAGRNEMTSRDLAPGFPPFQAFAVSADISLSPELPPRVPRLTFPFAPGDEFGYPTDLGNGADADLPEATRPETPSENPLQPGVMPFGNLSPRPNGGVGTAPRLRPGLNGNAGEGGPLNDAPDWDPAAALPVADGAVAKSETPQNASTETLAPAEVDVRMAVALRRPTSFWFDVLALSLAILCKLVIVVGMILFGYRHFGNLQTGIAAGALYLLLPYTSQMPGRLDHTLPGAIILWAVVAYRMPLLSGILLGLASGLSFYPIFLLPLWGSFYWRRGLFRFAIGWACAVALFFALLAFSPSELGSYGSQLGRTFGLWTLQVPNADGFWQPETQAYRIPVIAIFSALSLSLALWPAHKNLGTLMGCTAVVMLTTQYWQVHQGGLYMAWYAPLLVLTIFRPNLENRTALASVRSGNPWAEVKPRATGA